MISLVKDTIYGSNRPRSWKKRKFVMPTTWIAGSLSAPELISDTPGFPKVGMMVKCYNLDLINADNRGPRSDKIFYIREKSVEVLSDVVAALELGKNPVFVESSPGTGTTSTMYLLAHYLALNGSVGMRVLWYNAIDRILFKIKREANGVITLKERSKAIDSFGEFILQFKAYCSKEVAYFFIDSVMDQELIVALRTLMNGSVKVIVTTTMSSVVIDHKLFVHSHTIRDYPWVIKDYHSMVDDLRFYNSVCLNLIDPLDFHTSLRLVTGGGPILSESAMTPLMENQANYGLDSTVSDPPAAVLLRQLYSQRSILVVNKFSLAGSSCLWMFSCDYDFLVKDIQLCLDCIGDMQAVIDVLTGVKLVKSNHHVHALVSFSPNFECELVSDAVTRSIARRVDDMFIRAATVHARESCSPVLDGQILLLDVLYHLRMNTLDSRIKPVKPIEGTCGPRYHMEGPITTFWRVDHLSLPESFIYYDSAVFIPLAYHKGCFDFVVIKPDTQDSEGTAGIDHSPPTCTGMCAEFVQISRDKSPDLVLHYMYTFILSFNNVQTDLEMTIIRAKVTIMLPESQSGRCRMPESVTVTGDLSQFHWGLDDLELIGFKRSER